MGELERVPESPLAETDRQLALDVVRSLVGAGKLDLERFEAVTEVILGVRTEAELASALRGLPSIIAFTPAERRAREPVRIERDMGNIALRGNWQVGQQTFVRSAMGSVTVDLTEAEFDAWETELDVRAEMGHIVVIVPRGMGVQLVAGSGGAGGLQRALPGSPILRLRASTAMGNVTIRHPDEGGPPAKRRLFGRRRREKA